jgi:hypothetical protein
VSSLALLGVSYRRVAILKGMEPTNTCQRCGSERFVRGALAGVYFDPKATAGRSQRLLDPRPGVQAEVCLKCGALSLSLASADLGKLMNPPA